ncbi:hypothetical protein QOZ80_1AG0011580 [Eleusine coracana subsp. coracana]|nr:hypothetical protein QOZ80_1AG0011580 [Eleusine coracana subsp. coracana]
MEKDAASAGNNNAGRSSSSWDKSPVIVLPAGSAAAVPVWQQAPLLRPHKDQPAAAGPEPFVPEPPEKVFYKTRLCEKFENGGRCAYEDGCTFAHGHAELRPPLPLPPTARRSRMVMPPVDAASDGSGRSGGGVPFNYFGAGKVCFEFRDKGTCHFGDKCNFSHASPAVQPPDMRFPKQLPEQPARRAFSPAVSASIYHPAAARAFPPGSDDAAVGKGEPKPTRLELLSRKKMSGIYGDWPEGR